MATISFEWDEKKNRSNQRKHGLSFEVAQRAFLDPERVIARDKGHSSGTEERYFCIGRIGDDVVTVRFTHRSDKIRIFGAGLWRKGKKAYEEGQIHRGRDWRF